MKKKNENTRSYKLMCAVLLTILVCLCCVTKQVYAWNTYTSVEELKADMTWVKEYTVGNGQQLEIDSLGDVELETGWLMDANGNVRYDTDHFVRRGADETFVLCVDEYSVDSGVYYIVFNSYEDETITKGCIELTYVELTEMPTQMVALVGSQPCDYSICKGYVFPYKITYTSSDIEVATVDANGLVQPQMKIGSVTITAAVEYPNQEPIVYTGVLDVTDPQMPTTFVVARNGYLTMDIPGTSEYSKWYFGNDIEADSFSNKKCSVYIYENDESQCLQLSIEANNKKKSQTITVTIDGKVQTFTVDFSNPKLKNQVLVVKKGKSLKVPITGTKSGSSVSLQISDENIAGLTSTGKLKGKKLGTTWVNVEADGKVFNVLLVVQKGKMYKVVKYAADQVGVAKYSQTKRMKKGYYDCSSLVWRSYKAAGLNIGKTSWALNSDGFANYYYKKGKHYVGKKLKTNKKLKCGDIILRGKYKKGKAQTNHAELYIGDGYVIEAGDYGVHLSTTMGADIAVRPWP